MAHLDIWALQQLREDLEGKRIADSFSRDPSESYILPRKVGDAYEIPIYAEAGDTRLAEHVEILLENLEDWELRDYRKFALQYTQEKLLDRHLDFYGLQRIKSSRSIVNRATQPLADYVAFERQMLESALSKIPDSAAAENLIKSAITQLATDPAYFPPISYLGTKSISESTDR